MIPIHAPSRGGHRNRKYAGSDGKPPGGAGRVPASCFRRQSLDADRAGARGLGFHRFGENTRRRLCSGCRRDRRIDDLAGAIRPSGRGTAARGRRIRRVMPPRVVSGDRIIGLPGPPDQDARREMDLVPAATDEAVEGHPPTHQKAMFAEGLAAVCGAGRVHGAAPASHRREVVQPVAVDVVDESCASGNPILPVSSGPGRCATGRSKEAAEGEKEKSIHGSTSISSESPGVPPGPTRFFGPGPRQPPPQPGRLPRPARWWWRLPEDPVRSSGPGPKS